MHVVDESLVNTHLDELFQRLVLVGLVLQVDVSFLGDEEVGLAEVLFVGVQLVLEERNFATRKVCRTCGHAAEPMPESVKKKLKLAMGKGKAGTGPARAKAREAGATTTP